MKHSFRSLPVIAVSILVTITSCQKEKQTKSSNEDQLEIARFNNNGNGFGNISPEMVLRWNQAAIYVEVNTPRTPPNPPIFPFVESRYYAMVNIAMHDALNNIVPKYQSYALNARDKDADPDAAVAQAAFDVITYFYGKLNLPIYPSQVVKDYINDLLVQSLAGIENGEAKTKGIELGHAAAQAIIQNRNNDGVANILTPAVLLVLVHMGLVYGILYFILPRYLSKNKNPLITTGLLLLLVSVFAVINYFNFVLSFYLSTRVGYFTTMPEMNYIIPRWGRQILFNYPTVVGFALAIKLLKNWYLKQKETAEVAREKINAELQLLKAQVHPHFLFNTLNNIYSFIINDSSAAPDALKKLSALLRYIIDECNQPLVKLEKELKMIRDYIDLEKIRYGENFNMSLQVQGNVDNKMICPLLLIPFLENSFKHGASQMLTHPWINLDIVIKDEHLHFNLSNSKPTINGENMGTKGLGLRNVKKRLVILYPGTHTLNITDDMMSFNVSLKVPLLKPDDPESNRDLQEFFTERQAYELV